MKCAWMSLLLLTGCSGLTVELNYRTYALTWSCMSSDGCERAEQVILIDRAEIINGDDFIEFSSSRDASFLEYAQMVPSNDLPPECSFLHSLTILAQELEPSKFCRTAPGFELELSIPDRDPATQSQWLVDAREIDP